MVRRVTRRLVCGGALAATCVMLSAMAVAVAIPTAAVAAGPNSVTVSGPGLSDAVTVRAKDDPERFAAALAEVNWLAERPGQSRSPDKAKLGPKYVVTVYTGNKATHRYELYPLAGGGPRAYRPASQPDKHHAIAGWFYGRLSMPDTLRSVGVPLGGALSNVSTGGIGGGEVTDDGFDPNSDLTDMIAQWRQFLLLNGAVVVVIALGLAGISLLVRRRVDRRYRSR